MQYKQHSKHINASLFHVLHLVNNIRNVHLCGKPSLLVFKIRLMLQTNQLAAIGFVLYSRPGLCFTNSLKEGTPYLKHTIKKVVNLVRLHPTGLIGSIHLLVICSNINIGQYYKNKAGLKKMFVTPSGIGQPIVHLSLSTKPRVVVHVRAQKAGLHKGIVKPPI